MSPQADAAVRNRSLITLKAALRLPALRRGAPEILAGRCHLDRTIRWVHSGEVPNIAELLKGGELLLTTGMGIGKTPALQRGFVDELDRRGVAGVVIELGQRFTEIPPALVDQAEACGMPLVALHREVPFVEVTEAIHAGIVSRQFAVLRLGDDIHRRFTELMVEGAGIPEVLAVLASTIANPVLLEKAGQGVLYHVTHHAEDADVLAGWESLRAELEADPSATGEAIVLPVPATGHTTWGRLIALPLDSPVDDFARVAVERAVALVALALLRARQEELLATRARGNFLADLAAARLDPLDAAHRAEGLGFAHHGKALLPLAVALAPAAAVDEAAWTPVWRALRSEMHSRATPVLIGSRTSEDDVLVLLGLSAPERRREAADQAAAAIRAAVERHVGLPDAAIVAAGAAVAGWAEVPTALREAADAAAAARHVQPRPWHDATIPDVERLLWQLRDNADLRRFVERRLAPLVEHDQRRAAKLLPTLESLYEHGGRKAETARALHLERQSLYHRIERIERLLGDDLGDAETRLALHLALRARRHLAPVGRG